MFSSSHVVPEFSSWASNGRRGRLSSYREADPTPPPPPAQRVEGLVGSHQAEATPSPVPEALPCLSPAPGDGKEGGRPAGGRDL